MQALNHLRAVPQREKEERCPGVLARPAEKPPRALKLVRGRTGGSESGLRQSCQSGREIETRADWRIDVDFPFLKSSAPEPFTARLARELTEAVRAIKQDPAAFIRGIRDGSPLSREKKTRIRAGRAVAIAVYALALGGIYASYSLLHRVKPGDEPVQHLQITYLATPMPVTKPAPLPKDAGARTGKDRMTAPAKPAEQPKVELTEARPAPHPPDQIPARTELTTQPANLPASDPPSRAASDGAARGLTGKGVGTGPDGGRDGVSSTEVNYNDVFSISKVTTRPQILARPVPGYTEEARRAQIEGVVKVSVVLNANGTVSDIKVARGLGYGLDEKAIEAARELRFIPGQKDGHTVSVRVFLDFKFTLL